MGVVFNLLQAAGVLTLDTRAADVVQYILCAGIIGLFAVGWKISHELQDIKTIMLNPDTGIVPTVNALRHSHHKMNQTLTTHAFAINRVEESAGLERSAGLQPTDVGSLSPR